MPQVIVLKLVWFTVKEQYPEYTFYEIVDKDEEREDFKVKIKLEITNIPNSPFEYRHVIGFIINTSKYVGDEMKTVIEITKSYAKKLIKLFRERKIDLPKLIALIHNYAVTVCRNECALIIKRLLYCGDALHTEIYIT